MSPARVFETYGYPVGDEGAEAQANRRAARCPFTGRSCDAGGNRQPWFIKVAGNPELESFFDGPRDKAGIGVCSIQESDGGSPWIVCPRRLLALGREKTGGQVYQRETERQVLRLLDYEPGTRLGVWSEVRILHDGMVDGVSKRFQYIFDYLVMPLGRRSGSEIESVTGVPWQQMKRAFVKGGYEMNLDGGEEVVEAAPIGNPGIIEIMTSSTSGGGIQTAFANALLGKPHAAPTINRRQVWSRMVSQLIPKSEAALNWGGKTIWVVQDRLIDYISSSTRLDVRRFLADHSSEVNLLSFSYGLGEEEERPGVLDLTDEKLYAGLIDPDETNSIADVEGSELGFQDIIRSPINPPIGSLLRTLAGRKPKNETVVE